MTSEEKKFEIEDIGEPEAEEDIDLEQAVSDEESVEEPEKKEEKEEPPKLKEEPEESKIGEKPEELVIKEEAKKPFPKKLFFTVTFAILVTAALVLGGVFVYQKYFKREEKQQQDTTQQSQNQTQSQQQDEEPQTPSTEEYVYVTEKTGLNLRSEANASGSKIIVMPYGAKLKVIDDENSWLKVEYSGKTGWCAKEYTGTENPLVYTNEKYGFEITFPESWSAYQVKEGGPTEVALFYFELPTSDKTWKDPNADKAYASLLAVTVYSKTQYDALSEEGGSIGDPTATKGDYVYVASPAQATPSDLEARYQEITSIIKTFKTL